MFVNKGKEKGRGVMVPRPAKDLSCGLGEPHDRLLRCVGHLGVGACTTIQGVVAVHVVLGVERIIVLVSEEVVCAAASNHRVVAQSAVLGVVAASASELVGSAQTLEGVGSTPAIYGVVGLRARQGVVLGRADEVLHAREGVRALAGRGVGGEGGGYGGQRAGEVGCVRACAAVEGVVTCSTIELVGSGLALEDVVALEALYGIVAAPSADDVVSRGADEWVGAGGASYGAARGRWRRGGEGPRVVLRQRVARKILRPGAPPLDGGRIGRVRLQVGSWVQVGRLRPAAISLARPRYRIRGALLGQREVAEDRGRFHILREGGLHVGV